MRPLRQFISALKRGTPKTHDYTVRGWGHDYTFDPGRGGLEAKMMGWGFGIEEGDYLILAHKEGGTTRYQVSRIEYYRDPPDMWRADVKFAPRHMTRPTRHILAAAVLCVLAAPVQAGEITLEWVWPSTNADGTPLLDLNHGRLVLFRCVPDSLIRRTPDYVPIGYVVQTHAQFFAPRADSTVLPNIPATGREGDPDSVKVQAPDGGTYWANIQAVDHSGNRSQIASTTFTVRAK